MNYEADKDKILAMALKEVLQMQEGETTSAAALLKKFTEDDPGMGQTYEFFARLSRAVSEKEYVLSAPADQRQKEIKRNPFESPFTLLRLKEIPPVGDRAPMGWNSWDCYGASVTEEIVRQNADYMAKYLKPLGYEYVVVDIEWANTKMVGHMYEAFADLEMDAYGRLIPAVNRFPSSADGKGFQPLADYVHSLGLKFGIHIMRGIPRMAVHKNLPVCGSNLTARQIAQTNSICQWNTGMYGVSALNGGKAYYDSIFKLYAEWGVDFIKIDDICRELPKEKDELIIVSNALQECGRQMALSLSPGPALLEEAELYRKVAHMWRITDDFWDQWSLLYAMFERAEKWCIHACGGHYPDADMLPVGLLRVNNGGDWTHFSETEQMTMMSLWCIFRAPLMIGGEMTSFDDFTRNLLTNPGIIDMQKNSRHPHPIWRKEVGGIEHMLWTAQNIEGGQYAAIFNLGESDSEIEIRLQDLEVPVGSVFRELWTGKVETAGAGVRIRLPKHGSAVWQIG